MIDGVSGRVASQSPSTKPAASSTTHRTLARLRRLVTPLDNGDDGVRVYDGQRIATGTNQSQAGIAGLDAWTHPALFSELPL